MKPLSLILLMGLFLNTLCHAQSLAYKINYDFENNGDSWYGKKPNQNIDYNQATRLPTQEGDDFCVTFEPTLIHYSQGPALLRTQEKHNAYEFKYTATTDTSLCQTSSPPVPLPDAIFSDGFE